MIQFHNRKGEPISREEWITLIEDPQYVRLAFQELEGDDYVSTIWLGGPFVFRGEDLEGPNNFSTEIKIDGEKHQVEYPTEEDAQIGHRAAVQVYREQKESADELSRRRERKKEEKEGRW